MLHVERRLYGILALSYHYLAEIIFIAVVKQEFEGQGLHSSWKKLILDYKVCWFVRTSSTLSHSLFELEYFPWNTGALPHSTQLPSKPWEMRSVSAWGKPEHILTNLSHVQLYAGEINLPGPLISHLLPVLELAQRILRTSLCLSNELKHKRSASKSFLFFITACVCYWMAASIFSSATDPRFRSLCSQGIPNWQSSLGVIFI